MSKLEQNTVALQKLLNDVNNLPDAGGSVTPDNRNLYQRVEYIESDGNQYIITDFIPNNASGMELIASFPTLVDRVPMGTRYDSGTTRFYIPYPLSASTVYVAFNTGVSISCKLTEDTQYRLQMNFLNGRSARVHELSGLQKLDESISGTLPQHNGGIAIFGYRNDSTDAISSRRAMKFYSARCSQENEVVREYIPCYRKSDGVIGLYEKFSGQFFTNDGTGSFTTGSDVEW